MKSDFSTKVTGGSFIAAGLMLLLGWILLPTHIGTFFQPEDFAAVHAQWSFWIWMYRIHIFGMVVTTMALVALGALLSESAARILVWPGVAMAGAGMMVSALATAFYYHFGAWGALDMDGESPETILAFVESLRVSTEYVTCLVRFGRVFSGLGFVVLGLVSALATAFYYHFGAWGALDMDGESPETILAFVESLRVSTEYVTCLVRFGRVFSGCFPDWVLWSWGWVS